MSLGPRVRRLTDRVGFAILWLWIAVSFLFIPTMLGYPAVGVGLSLVAILLCWQAAAAKSHPVTTVGTRREVTIHPIAEPGHDCDECGAPAAGGERRRYVTRRVLFGTTVAVPEWGENRYCEACAVDPALETPEREPGADGNDEPGADGNDEPGAVDDERGRPSDGDVERDAA